MELKVPKTCEVACVVKMKKADKDAFVRAIDDEYRVHWTVDNLPVGPSNTAFHHYCARLMLCSICSVSACFLFNCLLSHFYQLVLHTEVVHSSHVCILTLQDDWTVFCIYCNHISYVFLYDFMSFIIWSVRNFPADKCTIYILSILSIVIYSLSTINPSHSLPLPPNSHHLSFFHNYNSSLLIDTHPNWPLFSLYSYPSPSSPPFSSLLFPSSLLPFPLFSTPLLTSPFLSLPLLFSPLLPSLPLFPLLFPSSPLSTLSSLPQACLTQMQSVQQSSLEGFLSVSTSATLRNRQSIIYTIISASSCSIMMTKRLPLRELRRFPPLRCVIYVCLISLTNSHLLTSNFIWFFRIIIIP